MTKRLGVVLVNLGTPEAPTKSSVRQFLREFLSDKRVVEIPNLFWKPILYGFILPFRPVKVAEAYRSVWLPEGSPLKVITEQQTEKLQEVLRGQIGDNSPLVRYAMTYGSPSIESRITELLSAGADKVLILPLYPQYSATTTGAVYDQYADVIRGSRNIPDVSIHKHYYERTDYLEALADSIREFQTKEGRPSKLLFSFHGIPKRCVDLGDPYYEHCLATAEATASLLGLKKDEWQISFQSRLGKAEWLKPYTSELLQEWGAEKMDSVQVVCPAFAADCLETLEEIRIENRDVFLEAGGKKYSMIPCMNDRDDHIQVLANIVSEYLRD